MLVGFVFCLSSTLLLQYRPGHQHQNADSLSRMKVQGESAVVVDDSDLDHAFRAEVVDDPWYRDIVRYLEGSELDDLNESTRGKVRTHSKHFLVQDGEFYRID